MKLISKTAFGYRFTYASRECYFATPAISVRSGCGGYGTGVGVLKMSQFLEGVVTF